MSENLLSKIFSKGVCVFLMTIWSEFRMGWYRNNNHREYAPHFNLLNWTWWYRWAHIMWIFWHFFTPEPNKSRILQKTDIFTYRPSDWPIFDHLHNFADLLILNMGLSISSNQNWPLVVWQVNLCVDLYKVLVYIYLLSSRFFCLWSRASSSSRIFCLN